MGNEAVYDNGEWYLDGDNLYHHERNYWLQRNLVEADPLKAFSHIVQKSWGNTKFFFDAFLKVIDVWEIDLPMAKDEFRQAMIVEKELSYESWHLEREAYKRFKKDNPGHSGIMGIYDLEKYSDAELAENPGDYPTLLEHGESE